MNGTVLRFGFDLAPPFRGVRKAMRSRPRTGHGGRQDRRDSRKGASDRLAPSGSNGGPHADRGRLIGVHRGGHELQAAGPGRRPWPPDPDVPVGWPDLGRHRRAGTLASIPQAGMPLADRGCDADWFCNALTINYIHLCMPSRKGDKATDGHDKNRLTTDAPSACVLAATVIYWVSVRSRRP